LPAILIPDEATTMDPESPESTAPAPPPTIEESSAPPRDDSAPAADLARLDPQELVARMVAAEEWPEPELLDRIIEAGDAAVEPLIAVLRTYPRGWPAEATLDHAIVLLGTIHPPRALPELIEIIRRYGGESGEVAAHALRGYGVLAFEPLLEVCRDPAVTGYRRAHAIIAARDAAGTDPILRARLAEVIRPYFADAIERARAELKRREQEPEVEADEDDLPEPEFEEDEAELSEPDLGDYEEAEDQPPGEGEPAEPIVEVIPELGGADQRETDEAGDATAGPSAAGPPPEQEEQELDLGGEIVFYVGDLAALADPLARDLIQTAFAEGLVSTFWIDEKTVEEQYRRGGSPPRPEFDWRSSYRKRYQRHIDPPKPRPMPPLAWSPRTESRREPTVEPTDEPTPMPFERPLDAPIRNVGPKLGRNEPCWCGSGKKYKKCHLSKDQRT
jgi:hypothetical protein